MARVLFLTELLPYPLVSGAKIRAYYVLRYLSQHHKVTLVSFVRPDDRPEHIEHLESFLHRVVTVPMRRSWLRNLQAVLVSVLDGRPAIIAREALPEMRRAVEKELATGQIDCIHADQIPMAQFGLLGRDRSLVRVMDQHNATFQLIERLAGWESNPAKRALLRREARAFARYEAAVCRQYDHVSFVTHEDRRALLGRMPQTGRAEFERRTQIIPICVDTKAVDRVTPIGKPFRVTHVGTMFWPPNAQGIRWFWEQVWPRVQEQCPQAMLTVIGKDPPEGLQVLGRSPQVEMPGYVADLEPYLAETAAFIVPLHAAGGMRVKIIDAWCWGLPVVSTTIGAEGIEAEHGEQILIADDPAAFAEAVVRVVHDQELQGQLRAAGRRWVEQGYHWQRVYQAWDRVYGSLGA